MSAYGIDPLHFRRGDVLRAEQLEAILEELRRPSRLAVGGAGLALRQGARGQVQVTATGTVDRSLGLVQPPGVTARAGSSPGSGTVELYALDPTAGTIFDQGVAVKAWNYSAGSAGIPAGKYCWLEQDPNGNWWVVSAEC